MSKAWPPPPLDKVGDSAAPDRKKSDAGLSIDEYDDDAMELSMRGGVGGSSAVSQRKDAHDKENQMLTPRDAALALSALSSPYGSPLAVADDGDYLQAPETGLATRAREYVQVAKLVAMAFSGRTFVMFPVCMYWYGGSAFLAMYVLALPVVAATASLLEVTWGGSSLGCDLRGVLSGFHARWGGMGVPVCAALLALVCSNVLLGACFLTYAVEAVQRIAHDDLAQWEDIPHGEDFYLTHTARGFAPVLLLSLCATAAVLLCASRWEVAFFRYTSFLLPIPVITLLALCLRAATLDGAVGGILTMFEFRLSDALSPVAAPLAVGQVYLLCPLASPFPSAPHTTCRR